MSQTQEGSIVLPQYGSGEYYANYQRPGQDSPFKSEAFLRLLAALRPRSQGWLQSYADVGCGSGGVAIQVSESLRRLGYPLARAAGYDISPHVKSLSHDGVEFRMQDFSTSDEHCSLITLFDVVEHVPDPVNFLRSISERCDFIGLHIPLDRSLANCFFDRFHQRLRHPGHLSILDAPAALNLVTSSGITPLDYAYTHGYAAPSGRMTWLQRAALPFRYAAAHLSPWLASRTVGGVSLMVFGATRSGLRLKVF